MKCPVCNSKKIHKMVHPTETITNCSKCGYTHKQEHLNSLNN